MRIPAILLLLLLAQIGWQGEQNYPLPPQVVEATVDSLAQEYYQAKFRFYPALATLSGVPGYDGKLSTYSERSLFGLLGKMRNLRRELDVFDEDSLSLAKWGEYKSLLADMAAQRFVLEDLEPWRSRPDIYVDACAQGVISLYLLGDRLPDPDPSERLRMVPQVVRHARRNLTKPSALHCRVASERLKGLLDFLRTLPGRAVPLKDPDAVAISIASLEGFAAFIDSLALTAEPEFALSYDEFMILLDTRNMLSDSPEDIRAYAEGVLEKVNSELKTYSEEPGAPARLEPEEADAYLESAREFISSRQLVGLPGPPHEPGFAFLEMPDFARPFFGGMLYAEVPQGTEGGAYRPFFISPDLAETGMNSSGLAAGGGLPGRHMQAVLASICSSPVGRMQSDIFAVDGWALYSQELMAREGFGGEEGLRAALEYKRFQAAGSVAAVNLLLGEFTVDQAARFMVRETGISEEYARKTAVQYALEPEQPISYIIGERQIGRIRDEVSGMKGDRFSLKAFHDSLLACGRLPLYIIRNNVVTGSMGRR